MKDKVRELISKSQTEKAMDQLLKDTLGSQHTDILVLKGKFERLEQARLLSLRPRDELDSELNQINRSLLELADKIYEEPELKIEPLLVSPHY